MPAGIGQPFKVSSEEHIAVVERIRQSSRDACENAFNDAIDLIRGLPATSDIPRSS
jgi:hypothetical protein